MLNLIPKGREVMRLWPRSTGFVPRQHGFTLLEVMVAVAVLAIALIGLLSLRNRDLSMQAHAEHLVTATSLAKSKLEEVSRGAVADLRGDSGEYGEDFPEFRWEWRTEPAALPAWLELSVGVSWLEGSREEQVTLVTYVPAL